MKAAIAREVVRVGGGYRVVSTIDRTLANPAIGLLDAILGTEKSRYETLVFRSNAEGHITDLREVYAARYDEGPEQRHAEVVALFSSGAVRA